MYMSSVKAGSDRKIGGKLGQLCLKQCPAQDNNGNNKSLFAALLQ